MKPQDSIKAKNNRYKVFEEDEEITSHYENNLYNIAFNQEGETSNIRANFYS